MRDMFGESEHYAAEFGAVQPWKLGSAGKSGSFLGFSPSGRYIMKSLPSAEFRKLTAHVDAYRKHMRHHPSSLLTRFLGVYTVRQTLSQHVVIMANALHGDATCERVYDLKGSWWGRKAKKGEGTLKDQDWCRGASAARLRRSAEAYGARGTSPLDSDAYARRFLEFVRQFCITDSYSEHPVQFPTEQATALQAAIEQDVAFLRSIRVMDYSLLVGVSRATAAPRTTAAPYVSIIDFLSSYGAAKHVQRGYNMLLAAVRVGARTQKQKAGGRRASRTSKRRGRMR